MSCANTITWQQWLQGGRNYQEDLPALFMHKRTLTFTGSLEAARLVHVCIQILSPICLMWDISVNKDTAVYTDPHYSLQASFASTSGLTKGKIFIMLYVLHKWQIKTIAKVREANCSSAMWCWQNNNDGNGTSRVCVCVCACICATTWQSRFHNKCIKFHCCSSPIKK